MRRLLHIDMDSSYMRLGSLDTLEHDYGCLAYDVCRGGSGGQYKQSRLCSRTIPVLKSLNSSEGGSPWSSPVALF